MDGHELGVQAVPELPDSSSQHKKLKKKKRKQENDGNEAFKRMKKSKRKKQEMENVDPNGIVTTSNIQDPMVSEIDSSVPHSTSFFPYSGQIPTSERPIMNSTVDSASTKLSTVVDEKALRKLLKKERKEKKAAKKEKKRLAVAQAAHAVVKGLALKTGVYPQHYAGLLTPNVSERPTFKKSNRVLQEQSADISSTDGPRYRKHADGDAESEKEAVDEPVESNEKVEKENSEDEEDLLRIRAEIQQKLKMLSDERESRAMQDIRKDAEVAEQAPLVPEGRKTVDIYGSDEGEVASDVECDVVAEVDSDGDGGDSPTYDPVPVSVTSSKNATGLVSVSAPLNQTGNATAGIASSTVRGTSTVGSSTATLGEVNRSVSLNAERNQINNASLPPDSSIRMNQERHSHAVAGTADVEDVSDDDGEMKDREEGLVDTSDDSDGELREEDSGDDSLDEYGRSKKLKGKLRQYESDGSDSLKESPRKHARTYSSGSARSRSPSIGKQIAAIDREQFSNKSRSVSRSSTRSRSISPHFFGTPRNASQSEATKLQSINQRPHKSQELFASEVVASAGLKEVKSDLVQQTYSAEKPIVKRDSESDGKVTVSLSFKQQPWELVVRGRDKGPWKAVTPTSIVDIIASENASEAKTPIDASGVAMQFKNKVVDRKLKAFGDDSQDEDNKDSHPKKGRKIFVPDSEEETSEDEPMDMFAASDKEGKDAIGGDKTENGKGAASSSSDTEQDSEIDSDEEESETEAAKVAREKEKVLAAYETKLKGATVAAESRPDPEHVREELAGDCGLLQGGEVSMGGVDDAEADQDQDQATEYEAALHKLQSLRSQAEGMSIDELETALKELPSFGSHADASASGALDDGRRTPVHLRDIELQMKSLVEYMHDKRVLYKQVFRIINKKEFKSMLPKPLRKFDAKTVRNWCLDEIEIMSRKRIRAVILQQYLASSSSEDESDTEDGDADGKNAAVIQADKKKASDVSRSENDGNEKTKSGQSQSGERHYGERDERRAHRDSSRSDASRKAGTRKDEESEEEGERQRRNSFSREAGSDICKSDNLSGRDRGRGHRQERERGRSRRRSGSKQRNGSSVEQRSRDGDRGESKHRADVEPERRTPEHAGATRNGLCDDLSDIETDLDDIELASVEDITDRSRREENNLGEAQQVVAGTKSQCERESNMMDTIANHGAGAVTESLMDLNQKEIKLDLATSAALSGTAANSSYSRGESRVQGEFGYARDNSVDNDIRSGGSLELADEKAKSSLHDAGDGTSREAYGDRWQAYQDPGQTAATRDEKHRSSRHPRIRREDPTSSSSSSASDAEGRPVPERNSADVREADRHFSHDVRERPSDEARQKTRTSESSPQRKEKARDSSSSSRGRKEKTIDSSESSPERKKLSGESDSESSAHKSDRKREPSASERKERERKDSRASASTGERKDRRRRSSSSSSDDSRRRKRKSSEDSSPDSARRRDADRKDRSVSSDDSSASDSDDDADKKRHRKRRSDSSDSAGSGSRSGSSSSSGSSGDDSKSSSDDDDSSSSKSDSGSNTSSGRDKKRRHTRLRTQRQGGWDMSKPKGYRDQEGSDSPSSEDSDRRDKVLPTKSRSRHDHSSEHRKASKDRSPAVSRDSRGKGSRDPSRDGARRRESLESATRRVDGRVSHRDDPRAAGAVQSMWDRNLKGSWDSKVEFRKDADGHPRILPHRREGFGPGGDHTKAAIDNEELRRERYYLEKERRRIEKQRMLGSHNPAGAHVSPFVAQHGGPHVGPHGFPHGKPHNPPHVGLPPDDELERERLRRRRMRDERLRQQRDVTMFDPQGRGIRPKLEPATDALKSQPVPLPRETFYELKERLRREEERQRDRKALAEEMLAEKRKSLKVVDNTDDSDDGLGPKIKSAVKADAHDPREEKLRMMRFLANQEAKRKGLPTERPASPPRDERRKPPGYDERKRQRELLKAGVQLEAREMAKLKIRQQLVDSRLKHELSRRERMQQHKNKRRSDRGDDSHSESDSPTRSPGSSLSRKSSERHRSLTRPEPADERHEGESSNLKELEFRARALQSLLSKKEESNRAYKEYSP